MKCNTCGKMNCYAHGGHVDDGLSDSEKREARSARHPVSISGGPNREESRHGLPHRNQRGTSDAWSSGKSVGHHMDTAGQYGSERKTSNRREEAKGNLSELKSMPKPKLKGLAHGGSVDDDQMNMYPMSPDVPSMHPKTMKDGGDVDLDHDMDSELESMIGDELMEAFEKKDKAGILDAIKALVMSCGGKL